MNYFGDETKKHANIFFKNTLIGRVVYYYWSKNNLLIRLHDKNKYVIAQFVKAEVTVILDDGQIANNIIVDGEE